MTASDVWKDWANPIETDRGSYHIRIQAKTRLCVVRLLVGIYAFFRPLWERKQTKSNPSENDMIK